MVSSKVEIKNPTGLHLRPAGVLCDLANCFECEVIIEHNGSHFSAKSVLGVLGASIKSGDIVTFHCDGPEEDTALNTIINAVNNGLGE